jgi:hypothetical protein
MNLFDLMSREHQRVDRELAACIDSPQSSHLTGADLRALRGLQDYLDAQQNAVYPALIALVPERADDPVLRHQRIAIHAMSATLMCRRAHPDATGALRVLHRAWAAHGEYEQTRLRETFEQVFTDDELRQLAGAMRLELAAPMDEDRGGGLPAAINAWRWLLHRLPVGRSRTLPALDDAVFVYRAS